MSPALTLSLFALTLSLFGNKMLKLALIIRSCAVVEHESGLRSFDEFDSSYDVPNAVYFWTNWKSHGIDYHNGGVLRDT